MQINIRESGGFLNRVFTSAIPLAPVMGMYALANYLISKRKYYLFSFSMILISMLISLSRAETVGFILGFLGSTFFIEYYSKNNVKYLRKFIYVFIAIVIFLSLNFFSPILSRFSDVFKQLNYGPQDILTGRYFVFLGRFDWLMNQSKFVQLFGPGRIDIHSFNFFANAGNQIDRNQLLFLASESSYLNSILQFGIIGSILFFINYFSVLITFTKKNVIKYNILLLAPSFGFFMYSISAMLSTYVTDSVIGLIQVSFAFLFIIMAFNYHKI